jgi:phosphoribosylamine--glycine ligase
VSVFALVSGRTIYVLETAQDHKAVGDGDTGANTGGMGAYSPAPVATTEILQVVERDVLVPIVDAMHNDGSPYSGVLYAGLMLTPGGPKVLEFNCRFGDPEAQVVLPRIASDPYEMFEAVAEGRLDELDVRWRAEAAVCVVMASAGYPASYETGRVIDGLDRAERMQNLFVYHAGTRRLGRHVATAGGRVLGVTALGGTIAEAKRRAYEGVGSISFEGAYFRHDISDRALSGR